MATQKVAELGFNLETGQFTTSLQKLSSDTSKAISDMIGKTSQLANGFESNFKKAGNSTQQFNKNLDSVSAKIKDMLTSFASLVGISTVIGSATKATTELHDAMIDISKLGDFTPQGLNKLKQDIKDLSQQIPLTTQELAKIAESGVQAGFPNEQIAQFVELTGKASSALNLIPEETADNLGKISSAFGGMPIARISKLADSVNYLEDSIANVKSKDLLEVLQRSAGAGQLAKLSEQQLGALGASLLSVGTNVEVAGSSINSFLGSLSAVEVQSAPFKSTMKALGFDLKQFADLAAKDGQSAVLKLLERLNQLDDVSRNNAIANLFGKGEDAQAVAKLVLNLDKYKDTLTKVANETNYLGNINKAAQKDQEKFSYQLATMKNSLANIGTTIMGVVEPYLAAMLKGVNALVKSIANFTAQHPNIMTMLGGIIAVGATASSIILLKNAFTALGAVRLVGLIGQVTGLTTTIGLLRGALTALAAHPAFIVITATAAIGYGIYKITQNLKEQAKQREDTKNQSFLNREYTGFYGDVRQKTDKTKYGAEESRLYRNTPQANQDLRNNINLPTVKANIPKVKEHIAGLADDDKKSSGKSADSTKEKNKIDLIAQYDKELELRKDYLAKMNVENNTFYEYSLQAESDFWKNKQKYVKGDDLIQVNRRSNDLQIQANKEKFDAEIEILEQGLDKFKHNYEQREKIAQEIYAKIAKQYGDQSPQAKKALYNVQQEQISKNNQTQKVKEIDDDIQMSSNLYDIESQEQKAQQALELEKITQAQFLQLQKQFLDKKEQLELKALEEKQARLAKDPDANPQELKNLTAEKLQILRNYEKQRRDIEFKAQLEKQKLQKQFQNTLEQSMANSIKGLIKGQLTLKDAFRNILTDMVSAFIDMCAEMLAKWVATKMAELIFGGTTSRSVIASHAAEAGAGAYASTAAIPIIGPSLAPVAANTAYFGAMAFQAMVPSARGGFDIPAGVNPMTQLHEKEMVLPAPQANIIRSLANIGLPKFQSFDIAPQFMHVLQGASNARQMEFNNTSQANNIAQNKQPNIVYNDNSGKLSPQDIRRNVAIIAKALVEYQKGKK